MAETRMFPVLAASFDLEFVKLSRRVIENVLQAQRDRFDASQRLFQTYAAALRDEPDMAARLDILGRRMGAHLQIEDAESGVQAGKAAGMRVAGLTSALPAGRLLAAGADAVIAGLDELSGLLGL